MRWLTRHNLWYVVWHRHSLVLQLHERLVASVGYKPQSISGVSHMGYSCLQGLMWDKLRCFSSTGEASSPEDYHWLVALAGYKPVIEYCGGTEIGGGFLGGTLVQPQAPSHFSTPTIGCRLAVLDDQEVLYDSIQGALCFLPRST